MKKLTLLFAALVLSFTAQAAIINGTPKPGDKGRLNWWVNGVVESTPVTQPGDTIVLADGTYEEESVIDFTKAGLVVMAAEGAKPVVKTVGEWMVMNITATTTFEGITFDSESSEDNDMYAFKLSANATFKNCVFQDYAKACIQVDENVVVNSLVIEDCVFDGANTTPIAIYALGSIENCTIEGTEFKNFTEYAITAGDWCGGRIDKLAVDNCLFHDCVYSAIYMPATTSSNTVQSCSDFELTNSTIYNVGDNTKDHGAVDIRDNANIASAQQVLIDHVTIYNFSTQPSYGGFMIYKSGNATISNCIAMNPADVSNLWINPFVAYTGATVSNCVNFNCGYVDNGATQSGLVKEDPMFVDAANADFMLYAESPAVGAGTDGSNLGDPRWGVKAGLKPGAKVLSKAVDAAKPGATITLGDGIYEESSSFDFDKEGLTIVAAEGTNPIIKTTAQWTSLGIVASTTFDGITFDGGNLTKTSLDTKGTAAQTLTLRNCEFKNYTDYNINIAENTTINTITIDNCVFDGVKATKAAIFAKGIVTTCTIEDSEFKNYAEYCITANDYYRGRIDNLSINNCLLHDGVAAIYMPNYADAGDIQTCANFSLTNSTIYNMVGTVWRAVIDIRSNPEDAEEALNKVVIDHITLYNFTTTELGGITSRTSTDVLITNSIIVNPADNTDEYAYRLYGASEIKNTLTFNTKTSGGTPTNPINADPLFVDAAENNFDLYANSPAVGAGTDGSNLGDPRWGVSDKTIGTGKRVNVTTADVESFGWIVNNAASNLQPGDTLVLADGQYTLSTIKFIKENVVVMAAENAKPEIISASEWANLEISANTTFDGITFNGNNVAQYLISIQDSTTMKTKLVLQNCELKNWKQWAISNQYSKNVVVDSLIIDNCLFHDGTNSAVYFSANAPEGKHACQDLKITNSTFYNIGNASSYATVYSLSNANAVDAQKVTVDHCTFYNCQAKSTDHGAVRVSCAATISNTIIVAPESQGTYRAIYAADYSNAQAINCLTFNYEKDNGGIRSAASKTNCYLNIDPLFVDAANNNFMLQANSPAIGKATDGSNLGDPRWGVAEPELITLTTGDNDAVIEANKGKTVNVKIERSFTANVGYYTLCVPFNMPASVIGKAYSLGTITEHVSGQGININLEEVSELSAGTPYLVLPKANMSELVVENVTIQSDIASGQNVGNPALNINIFFEGFYSAPGRTTNETTEYYVGNNGYLYNDVVNIRGLCGLFTITDTAGNPTKVRARVVTREDAATGLDNNQLPITNIQKAIENGQLIIIRDGVKYNVQGQKL